MNTERLLQHFDRIAEAPDAVAHLRRFILDLAVRGKLVDQDPNDEPALELLKRIQEEKTRLVKEGFIKKGKQFSEIEEDEVSFDIPNAWRWVRIRQITSDRGQAVPTTDFTYIDVTSINKERGCISEPKILSVSETPSRARKLVRKDDVIYSCVRPYLLNIAIVDTEIVPPPIASTAFAILYGFGLVLPRYLWITLRSPFMVESVEAKMRGQAYPAINDADFAVLPIPLPPLPEQHRIVAKVDELMGLCDRLQFVQQNRESHRDRLVAASLHHLNQSAETDERFGDRAQFYFKHLPELAVRSEHIKQLRHTILNLAVRGKLVPQDPNDEPASELLKRIQTEKKKPKKLEKNNNESLLPSILSMEETFELPINWVWVVLEQIAVVGTGATPSRGNPEYYNPPIIPWVTSGETGQPYIHVTNEYVSELALKRTNLTLYPIGTLVVAMYGQGKTRGQVTELCIEATTNQACAAIVLTIPESSHRKYIKLFFEKIYDEIREQAAGGAQPNLNLSKIKSILLSLPPLAEQHRIVAKVDELMGLCDRLEAQLSTTQANSRRLLESLLHEALAPSI
jgi:type I restriction enzyme, S subunit